MSIERQIKLLNYVRQMGSLTRADLAKLMDLNSATIVRLVATLLDNGTLLTAVPNNSERGRPSENLSLNPQAAYALGLEFGRDQGMLVILDALGKVILYERFTPPPFKASQASLESLANILQAALKRHSLPWHRLAAIGLSLHDIVDANGVWITHEQPDSPFNVQSFLTESLQKTIIAEDVSRSFAFAEQQHGAAKEQSDMIYVFLGSHGVGGGIFVNGSLLKSSSGVCGELGHIVVDASGAQCHCGSQGCLETVATHKAIESRFKSLVEQGVKTTLAPEEVNFAAICQAAATGDKPAYLVLDELAEHMGQALAAAINISGSPFILVGGQLQRAGSGFLSNLEAALRRRVVAPLLKDIQVRYATLPPYAGAWGAALMALERAFSQGSFLSLMTNLASEENASVLESIS